MYEIIELALQLFSFSNFCGGAHLGRIDWHDPRSTSAAGTQVDTVPFRYLGNLLKGCWFAPQVCTKNELVGLLEY